MDGGLSAAANTGVEVVGVATNSNAGSNGGSGVVVVRYKKKATSTPSADTPSCTTESVPQGRVVRGMCDRLDDQRGRERDRVHRVVRRQVGRTRPTDHAPQAATITTFGDYVIHNFTSNGTFAVTDSSLTEVDVLVVGGGGGGGGFDTGGGGGGGAVLYSASKTLSSSSITVTVGTGGTGTSWPAGDGGASAFDSMVANGGKAGSSDNGASGGASGSGNAGGSGR